jgi:hypothetical protein
MNSHKSKIAAIGILVAVAGCAATPPPTLQTGPDAEVSVDGLVRVDNSVVAVSYRKPGMDLTGYTRFMLDPVEVAYQKDPGDRRRSTGVGPDNFALTASQMERLKSVFQEEVVAALTTDGGYELTTEPAPDVLRISAALIDLVVTIPTESAAQQQNLYTRSYGLVTLVLELRDSQSGEILARAGDRRDPTRDTSGNLARVSSTFVRADVRRLFAHWAGLLREGLDAVRAR